LYTSKRCASMGLRRHLINRIGNRLLIAIFHFYHNVGYGYPKWLLVYKMVDTFAEALWKTTEKRSLKREKLCYTF
jgi:hypothetical protein